MGPRFGATGQIPRAGDLLPASPPISTTCAGMPCEAACASRVPGTCCPPAPPYILRCPKLSQDIPRYPRISHYIPRYPKISQDIARRRCQCRRCRHRLLPAYPAYSAYPAYPRSRATAEAARTPPQATRSPAKTQPQAHTPCKNLAFTLYIGPYIIHSVPALRPNP